MRLPQGLFVFRALSFKKVDTKLVLTGSSEGKKKKKTALTYSIALSWS